MSACNDGLEASLQEANNAVEILTNAQTENGNDTGPDNEEVEELRRDRDESRCAMTELKVASATQLDQITELARSLEVAQKEHTELTVIYSCKYDAFLFNTHTHRTSPISPQFITLTSHLSGNFYCIGAADRITHKRD